MTIRPVLYITTLILMISVCAYPFCTAQQESSNSVAQIESSWRKTEFGWQDSSRWWVDSFTPNPGIEQVHPAIWAGLVLILVMMAMIWASNEQEIADLLGEDDDN